MLKSTLLCLSFIFCFTALAGWELTADIEQGTRIFDNDQNTLTQDTSYYLRPGFLLEVKGDSYEFKLSASAMLDNTDEQWKSIIPEDNYFQYYLGDFTFTLGTKIYNWSATEFFHPADVLNSKDLNSRLDRFKKLGQSIISASMVLGDGQISLFVSPYLILPRAIGTKSHFSLVSNLGSPQWTDHNGAITDEKFIMMPGLRFTQTIGDADISAHIIRHVDREAPIYVVNPLSGQYSQLYLMVTQFGFTYQHALPYGLILKVEHASKFYQKSTTLDSLILSRPVNDYHTSVVSLETGMSHEHGRDSTFVFEGQFITGVSADERKNISYFQQDVMIGYKFSFNDIESKEFFASFIFDIERSGEYVFNVNYNQRIGESWKFDAGFFLFFANEKIGLPSGLEQIDDGDHIYTTLTKYF